MASKRRQRRVGCAQKKAYPHRHAAERACVSTAVVERNKGFYSDMICALHPYRCSHCGQWHIGHERTNESTWKSGKA